MRRPKKWRGKNDPEPSKRRRHEPPELNEAFGIIVVTDPTIVIVSQHAHVRAKCPCGIERLFDLSILKSGKLKSCGCGIWRGPKKVKEKAVWRNSDYVRNAVKPRGTLRGKIPDTADVLYDQEQVDFMMAIERYQRASGVRYPDMKTVFALAIGLGYRKDREIVEGAVTDALRGGLECTS